MRPIVADRVKETTLTTGTGTIALAGAASGFRSFAQAFSSGQKLYYLIVDDPTNTTAYEVGIGTFTSGTPNTLSRDTVIESSNSNNLVNFSAGGTVIATPTARFLLTIIDALDSDIVTTGTSTAYAISTYRADPTLYEGKFVCFKLHTTCGSSPTLNVDGAGAKALVDLTGTAIASGALISGAYYWCKYDATNTRWVVFSPFAYLSTAGGTLSGALNMSGAAINEAQGSNIASASTINLDTATGNLVDVTGTTTITAITLSQGRSRTVRFTGALTLTNGASLVLPGGANITTAAGDFAVFRGYSGGVVRCVSYTKASGQPVTLPAASTSAAGVVQKATTAQVAAETADRYSDAASLKYHPGIASAWVRFDGATGNIISGYNVASVSRPSQGNYTVNFSAPMADANYAIMVSCSLNTSRPVTVAAIGNFANITTSGFPITIKTQDGSTTRVEDAPVVTAVVYGAIA